MRPAWDHPRKIGWLAALEDPIDVSTIPFKSITRVGDQRYDLGKPGSGGHGNAELRQ
jgi:hypothetical protein